MVKIDNHYIDVLDKVAINHIDIELTADFNNEKLKGFVDLSVTKIDESCNYIVWYTQYNLYVK